MTIKGIDVSSIQGTGFSTSGMSFCFVKATEGHTYINPDQVAQAAKARAAGLVVGFYAFLWPGNIQAQAEYFVEKCASIEGDVLICDWETTSDGTRASGAEKDQFLAAVKKLRPTHRVVLYCNRDFWINHDTTSNAADGLWIAEYNGHPGQPSIQAAWKFHQYTSSPLDTSVADFASKAALASWAGAPVPKPKVSLKNLIAAARRDPGLPQGGTTHPADVKIYEAALKAEGLLAATYASDGSFGSTTIKANSAWQKAYSKAHNLGWSGADVDGIPGKTSTVALGAKRGFTVTT